MWHRRPWAGPTIRIAGLAALGIAVEAARLLLHSAGVPPADQSAMDYLLALIAFVLASAGSAMLFVGAHLFDEVEVSLRWRTWGRDDRSLPALGAGHELHPRSRAASSGTSAARETASPRTEMEDQPAELLATNHPAWAGLLRRHSG